MSKAGASLEERKRRVIETWVHYPKLTYPEIAAKAGVSDSTFYRYRQDPDFMKQYHDACDKKFKCMEALAMQALKEQINDGNFQAVKYLLENLGYKSTDKLEANVQSENIVVTIED